MVVSVQKSESSILEINRVISLIKHYQRYGHLISNVEAIKIPLEYKSLGHIDISNKVQHKLTLQHHGFTLQDLDKTFNIYTENIQVTYLITILGTNGNKNTYKTKRHNQEPREDLLWYNSS